ncbi:MAG: DJ-1/PfpI family protein [bacterium]|nr:DJ-1/PfpI family protein [bacterium]
MSHQVLVPLADGFEEIEAITIIDVLRRAELDVVIGGLAPGVLTGARGIRVESDAPLASLELESFDAVVLPGGMGGTLNMIEDARLLEALRAMSRDGKLIAAICAAPMVLVAAGIVSGVPVTSHPSVRDRLGDADVRDVPRVVRAESVMTSQGPGTAMEFALAIVEELCGPEKRAELEGAMVVGS